MKKRPVYLPEDLYHDLAQRATREGASIEELVRFAVAQTYKTSTPAPLIPESPAPAPTPLPKPKTPRTKAAAAAKAKPKPTKLGRPPLRPSVPPPPTTPREPVPDELYVRHQTVDEGLYHLDAYLDAAYMSGHIFVRIVHGKGGGILRGAVWQRLKAHPLVRSYRLAGPGEGDAGVTVVELARR